MRRAFGVRLHPWCCGLPECDFGHLRQWVPDRNAHDRRGFLRNLTVRGIVAGRSQRRGVLYVGAFGADDIPVPTSR